MDRLQSIANRLHTLIDPWDREYASIEELTEEIQNDPLAVIEFLLDRIDES